MPGDPDTHTLPVATTAGEKLAPSQAIIRTSYLSLQGGWLGLLFLFPLEAGGRNEHPQPPPLQSERLCVCVCVGGGAQMQQEEASPTVPVWAAEG